MLGRKAAKLLRVCDFGEQLISYGDALQLQKELAALCKSQSMPDILLKLQHPPVYTLGKRGKYEDFLISQDAIQDAGAEIFMSPRGGEVTFHGPGQIVLYPIINLRRLGVGARAYVEGLEDTVVNALHTLGICSKGRQPGRTGVWVEDRKIAAIGVQISRGIATHGLAVNVTTNLDWFKHIVPCGLADKDVTSVQLEKGSANVADVSRALTTSFVHCFAHSPLETVSKQEIFSFLKP